MAAPPQLDQASTAAGLEIHSPARPLPLVGVPFGCRTGRVRVGSWRGAPAHESRADTSRSGNGPPWRDAGTGRWDHFPGVGKMV